MHEDLRRRALESKKTVSKKLQAKGSQPSSRASSRAVSAANSRPTSRVVSRDVSDDEDDRTYLSDDTNMSINSIDALLESDDFNEQTTDTLKDDLQLCIEDLLERKGSSSKSREDALVTYDRILTSHHFGDVLYGQVENLLKVFVRSVKAETTVKETVSALRAISLTCISIDSATLYDEVSSVVKRTISDSQDNTAKAAAIHCLGICLSFGGAGDEEIAEVNTFLLEVVRSDGEFVGAADSAEVVTAASQTYAFLTTQLEDVEGESEDAVEAFLEQLNSGEVAVQIAAGEAIALLFEKSYTPREEDEEPEEHDQDDGLKSDESDNTAAATTSRRIGDKDLVKRYNAYHNPAEVLSTCLDLANLSTRGLNRSDRKKLHQSFASIAQTVENPRVGLLTNNASRMKIRIQRQGEIKVDKWWKFIRLQALRRLLGGGFLNHYFEGNRRLIEVLPVIVRGGGGGGGSGIEGLSSPRRAKGGDRYKEGRKFVGLDDV